MAAALSSSHGQALRALMAGLLVTSTAARGGATSRELQTDGPREVVFAVRGVGRDGHWYANFGQYAPERLRDTPLITNGAKLCTLDTETGAARVLLDDPEGGIRDPQVDYDGRRILFSYRQGGSGHYHLHEINSDGSGLRRLTDGPFDDIEPTWLPDGDIIFVSSRARRWVNCWLTPVANLHRCGPDGAGIHPVSANIEHDNTPWPLPDGRILFTRWEYIDRSQIHFHHLWSINPDGTGQMTYFGNQSPGGLLIDAKPVPGSPQVVTVHSPGHGNREHAGWLALIDPRLGPDDPAAVRRLTKGADYRDPWAFREDLFLAARGPQLVLCDGRGNERVIYALGDADQKAGLWCHEPRPLAPRPRELVIPAHTDPRQETGRMMLMDARIGRNMTGVGENEIRDLLVIESLPKPINYTGGMDPLSYGGTFTLERLLGTVPVEEDGSAYFEVPALRSVFFVARDAQGKAVKRMRSFTSVKPGETIGCVGCHEHRSQTPPPFAGHSLLAMQRPPSPIEPLRGVPDVFDFPRDIQPILDRHCVECHHADRAEGGVILTGDRGPMFSHSYFMLTITGQLADGRNQPGGNDPPRSLGSGAAPLLAMLEGGHHDVRADERELETVRLWLDTGAAYPGTYAALGTGMIGGYEMNEQVIGNDRDWPTTRAGAAVIERRCASCHHGGKALPRALSDENGLSFWMPKLTDPRIGRSRHIVFNLDHPERSLMLLAPLAKTAGGHGTCREAETAAGTGAVLPSTDDPDYRTLWAMIDAGGKHLRENGGRFDMPDFRPRPEWVREMIFYGILPAATDPLRTPIDVYQTERRYWESLHHRPR
ncbi:MAG TPA: hypothetical protein VLO11_05965 [Luteolibacter sp.]|nr:hypothetical protein [Luteolibacter sp.]